MYLFHFILEKYRLSLKENVDQAIKVILPLMISKSQVNRALFIHLKLIQMEQWVQVRQRVFQGHYPPLFVSFLIFIEQ